MSATVARFPGTCPQCGGGIREGDVITRDLQDAWVHVQCPADPFDFDPADTCPECFTVRSKSGACSCPQ